MGRIPESTTKDRFGVYGESKMSGKYGEGDQGFRLSAGFRYSPGMRRGRQRNDSLDDIAAPSGQKDALLQSTTR